MSDAQTPLVQGLPNSPSNSNNGNPNWLNNDLGPNNPLPWQVYMPDQITGATGLASSQMGRGNDYYSGNLTNGLLRAKTSLFNRSATGQEPESPLSGQDAAIAQNAQGAMDRHQNKLQTMANATAPMMAAQSQDAAATEFGSAQNLAMKNFQDQYNFQMQRYNLYNQWQAQQSAANANFLSQAIGAGVAIGAAVL